MNLPQPIKFCIVGGSGVLVNTCILYVLKEMLGYSVMGASALAITSAISWNYVWNDTWTFKESETQNKGHTKAMMFAAICIIGAGINMGVLWLLTGMGVYYLLANLAGIAAATGWNYVMNKRVTWG